MQGNHASFLNGEFVFRPDEDRQSSATRVIFNNSDLVMRHICLKMWLECHNELYSTGDLTKQTGFLLEGLAFNRQFSGNVCDGIVPVLFDSPDMIKCGPLIENPARDKLVLNRPYALVMKRLKEGWQLDHQLRSVELGSIAGMEFLAYQVAGMHRKLERSLGAFGTPERIADKLHFNIEQFHRALNARRANPQIMTASAFSEADMTWIESASMLLKQVSKAHQQDFKERRRDSHIKRCHGDLKTTNLWICPPDNESRTQKRLIALDCVDFNPEFCNIDTLSDVAMLAIDLETRLVGMSDLAENKARGQQLARHFLHTYLEAAGERKNILPILEYYLIEKAMVCSYMSILFDHSPVLGERYLDVVLTHSQNLASYLPQKIARMITKPLYLIAN